MKRVQIGTVGAWLRRRWPGARGERVALIGLLAIIAAGGCLRWAWMLAYRPAIVGYPDEISYMVLAKGGQLWAEPARDFGYPLFLREIGRLVEPLSGIILMQHVFGIATGVILFLLVRRTGAPSWLGLLPAAIVMLNGTEVILEHMVLTEALFILLVSSALYCAARAGETDAGWSWALAAGIMLGAASTVRVVGLPLLAVVIPWLLFVKARHLRARAVRTGAAMLGVAAVLGPYAVAQHAATDHWGVTPRAGIWNLYARVAPFADCRKFTPPAGTEALCEQTPPEKRTLTVEGYNFLSASPANQLFGVAGSSDDPQVNRLLGQWTREVIIHQPWDYARTVIEGLGAYIVRTRLVFANRDGIGPNYEQFYGQVIFDPAVTQSAISWPLAQFYLTPGLLVRQGWVDRLIDYEEYARVKGWQMFLLMSLSIAALVAPRGQARRVGVLLFATAWMSLIIPPATHWWDPRAAIVPLGILAAAAALGAWQVMRWASSLRARLSARKPAAHGA